MTSTVWDGKNGPLNETQVNPIFVFCLCCCRFLHPLVVARIPLLLSPLPVTLSD